MNSDLTSAPIPLLVRRLAIPAGTGFFFNTMFNVVDTWYGGKLSTTALAAMSLSFPVFFIMLSVGMGISSSTTALVGSALGRGDRHETRMFILQAFSFASLQAVLLTLAGLALSPAVFRLMGASGDYLTLATVYMQVIFAGCSFFLLNFAMSATLSAHGDTTSYRNFLIAGFFLNLLLDPWFMYGGFGIPSLGLAGVALSTIAIQALGTAYLYRQLARTGAIGRFSLPELIPRRRYLFELCAQGFPAAMSMLTVSIGIFIITWFVGRFGTEAVAAYGIGTRIEQIALLPAMGLNVSTIALTAQNFGAAKIDRIRSVLAVSLRYGTIISVIGTTAALLLGSELIGIFTGDPAVISQGTRFLQIESFVFPAYILLYISTSVMQGIQRPALALWIGLYRQIAAPIAVFYLLTAVFGSGISGIWWGIFGVTWSAAILVVIVVTRMLKKMEEEHA